MSEWTKGPWKHDEDHEPRAYYVVSADLGHRIIAGDIHGGSSSEARANSRLIAAAPDLAEAARLCLAYEALEEQFLGAELDKDPVVECGERTLDALRAALAKAEGRQS